MLPTRRRRSIIPPRKALWGALLWSAVISTYAETNPFYLGTNVSLAHDSNVFRLPRAIADTSYSAGLSAGFDQPIGRQRVYARGSLSETRFEDMNQLDHTSYGINAGLDWETVGNLSGALSFAGSEGLFNYGGTNTEQATARNIETRSETVARIKYGAAALLAVEASLGHRTLRYSDAAYRSNGLTQDAVGLGFFFRPSNALRLGAGLRIAQGRFEGPARDFDRRDIDLTGQWFATGLSTLDGRLSLGRQESKGGGSALDFSGATGQLIWTYRPTGKLQIKTSLSRDSGAESGFLKVEDSQTGSAGDTSRITNALLLNAAYALSPKIRVDAGFRANHRSLVSGAFEGSDSLRSALLGVTYEPLRNVALSCHVSRETRSASGSLSFGYGASSATCTAEIKLQ
ncbi:MAG: hypothetical protein Q7T97_00385 [Burkholderiaceae bacterium]|nr:hypothetical protein [Burkholderiaceae bacterium]